MMYDSLLGQITGERSAVWEHTHTYTYIHTCTHAYKYTYVKFIWTNHSLDASLCSTGIEVLPFSQTVYSTLAFGTLYQQYSRGNWDRGISSLSSIKVSAPLLFCFCSLYFKLFHDCKTRHKFSNSPALSKKKKNPNAHQKHYKRLQTKYPGRCALKKYMFDFRSSLEILQSTGVVLQQGPLMLLEDKDNRDWKAISDFITA